MRMASLNADPSELNKFSDLAHRWWDPESEFKPLHQINPLRLNWINQHHPLAKQQVLDVGCGGGLLSEAMARLGAEKVLGIDLAEKSIRAAQLHAMESDVNNVAYDCVSTEALSRSNPCSFDVVTCMEMLEHVPDPASIVGACAHLVKPGGTVFFSTLNRNPKAYLLGVIGAEYLLGLVPKGTHDYQKFIRPSELVQMASHCGLDVLGMTGLSYNPMTKRFALGKDTDVNYAVAFRKTTLTHT
jgi:2-polyprenyl-6-hydroxyphenyl methylase / 3-demethylubiquinone-9 3-methyltransferase